MLNVYGIKTCTSVRKALKFFKENEIEINFIDLKKEKIPMEQIERWLQSVELSLLFNSRGTTYRNLKLKELNLEDNDKKDWLSKESMLFKRPVIEYKNEVIVGFNEEVLKKIFV